MTKLPIIILTFIVIASSLIFAGCTEDVPEDISEYGGQIIDGDVIYIEKVDVNNIPCYFMEVEVDSSDSEYSGFEDYTDGDSIYFYAMMRHEPYKVSIGDYITTKLIVVDYYSGDDAHPSQQIQRYGLWTDETITIN